MTGKVARLQVADTGTEESQLQKKKKRNSFDSLSQERIRNSNLPPPRNTQKAALEGRGEREREERAPRDTGIYTEACQLGVEGTLGEGADHSAELYTVMSCMTFQLKGDHIYDNGSI